jgi:Bestrophin, RFP-TM, chloride channel
MRTCNVLSIACAAALVRGTASFAGGISKGPATTTPQYAFQKAYHDRRRRARSYLQMSMNHGSNLFPFHEKPVDSLGYNVNNRHSASDWLHNVFTLPRSSVLRDIRNPVVTIAVWGALVSIIQRIMAQSTSKVLTKFASDICIGSAPHSFLVSSLGLLLVFRTNSAYQRFNVSPRKEMFLL